MGETSAGSIRTCFSDPRNLYLVARLREAGVCFEMTSSSEPTSDLLVGQSIVISGVFEKHSRDEYKHIIEQHGGKNSSSISSKTSFILAGSNMGPAKLEKARSLGVRIVSEDEFLAMLS